MFLVAAAPVPGPDGEVAGVVYGGLLLNSDRRLVDRISRVVFRRGDSVAKDAGNTTIFLDDVRIATTVPDNSGQPAVGSLMSAEVHAAVSRGERWTGSAFVLNERHFSAYEPLRDYRGAVIGALYAGMPERPYRELRWQMNLIFSTVLFFVTLVGIGLSAWLGSSLARPIKALEEGVRRIAASEALPDIPAQGSDEIASLAGEFNVMKRRLAEREEENLSLNRTLEQKVIERTAQLEERNSQLLGTQKELAEAERLAGIGLLASGVAHEINNPLAIIRGNAELLELYTGEGSGGEEVETILRQSGRIERIVQNLLTFSRSGIKQSRLFSVVALLDGILDQVGHQIDLGRCTIARNYRHRVLFMEGDEEQLRQVFTNLVVNALQAMDGQGLLTIDATADTETEYLTVTVADTGQGIPAEHLKDIFTPFFTTKPTGTGLGLSVSYGIVENHGGTISVASTPGSGSLFTVTLPLSSPPPLQ